MLDYPKENMDIFLRNNNIIQNNDNLRYLSWFPVAEIIKSCFLHANITDTIDEKQTFML
jgi:hypothetical protein